MDGPELNAYFSLDTLFQSSSACMGRANVWVACVGSVWGCAYGLGPCTGSVYRLVCVCAAPTYR